MNTSRLLAVLLLSCLILPVLAQEAYTPKAGSAERKAICDGVRAFLIQEHAQKKLPKPIVLKIDCLKVAGDYCFIECIPMFEDGSDAVPAYLPDIGYTFCLKRFNGWRVILDLSRTDVPGAEEIAKIKKSFPADFPMGILSDGWKEILAGKYN